MITARAIPRPPFAYGHWLFNGGADLEFFAGIY